MRVLVPFGAGNRGSDGVVLSIGESGSAGQSLKAVETALDEEPVLDHGMIQLALWMRERCFCTVYDCVKAMLPAGLYFSLRDQVSVAPGVDRETAYRAAEGSQGATRLLDLLWSWGGKGDMEQIRLAFGAHGPQSGHPPAGGGEVAAVETSAQRGVGDKTEKLAVLALPPEDAMAMVAPRRRSGPPALLGDRAAVRAGGGVGAKELCYFTGASMPTMKSLEKSGILTLETQEVFRRLPLSEACSPLRRRCSTRSRRRPFRGWTGWPERGRRPPPCCTG